MFKTLEAKDTRLLRGQLALVAAAPGIGKSAFALTLAMGSGVPCLYFSADSDAFTQVTRMISIASGCTLSESAEMVLTDDMPESVSQTLGDLPIRFDYDASPSLDTIDGLMASYDEVFGDYPALVVIDNITNVWGGGAESDDPFSGLESLLDYLHTMARKTEACVIGLHHVTGPYNDGDKPIPLSGLKGQVGRVPELVLTLHKQNGDDWNPTKLCVSTVKNRSGKADPSGADFAELRFEGQRMLIDDFSTASDLTTNSYEYEAA